MRAMQRARIASGLAAARLRSARRDAPPCETVCPGQGRRKCVGAARWATANAEVHGSRSALRSDIRFRTASAMMVTLVACWLVTLFVHAQQSPSSTSLADADAT